MAMKVKVGAELDTAAVEQQLKKFQAQLNAMGAQIAQANKAKFEPISKTSLEDMKRMVAQFETLRRVSGDLRQRLKATGQANASFLDIDWSKLYPDQASRARQMRKAFEYVTGQQFAAGAPPPGRRPPPSLGQQAGAQAANVVNAGLSAMGPVGGVAGSAISTTMRMGAGAGLIGLIGGLAALGIGKLVGAGFERIGAAENDQIGYDRLKRSLGDVNVSFERLKETIRNVSGGIHTTWEESQRLAASFVRLGNVTSDQADKVADEIGIGGGLSRALGLDPSLGVGFLGQMRGLRLTGNDQESRKLALLIGEAVGRSDAFAKADEVMEAIAGFAQQQTRASLSANVAGYAGAFSALTGSGIPGLDPMGSASLLARVNAALSAGGARGEASQFFTGMLGARLGLDPFQMQIWREGGAFGTLSGAFGPGSIASRFGISGPTGNQTFLSATLDALRAAYGNNPGMLANAAAGHLGIGMNQAMALLSIGPNQMGAIEKRLAAAGFDLTKLNASGITALSKIEFGTDADRAAIANELLNRTEEGRLSDDEKRALAQAFNSGDPERFKTVLSSLVGAREQADTQGKDIHDAKTALENIQMAMADKLVPLTQDIRAGILYLAGDGKKSQQEVLEGIAETEHNVRTKRIRQQILAAQQKYRDLYPNDQEGYIKNKNWLTTEELPRLMNEERLRYERELESIRRAGEADTELRDQEAELRRKLGERAAAGQAPAGVAPPAASANVQAFLHAIGKVEGADYSTIVGGGRFTDFSRHPGIVGMVTGDGPSTAAGKYQITQTTWNRLMRRLGLSDFSPASQDAAAIELLRESGALADIEAGNIDAALAKLGGIWQGLPTGRSRFQGKRSRSYFNRAFEEGLRLHGTQAPADLSGGSDRHSLSMNLTVDPLTVTHVNERGEHVRPPEHLRVTVTAPAPFGTARYGHG